MVEEWKKTKRQGELIRLFPSCLLKYSKKVWRWAIELRNGRLWTFFILSAIQWLPYKAREMKGQNKDARCFLCLSGEPDNFHHALRCPALLRQHNTISETFQRQMREIRLPFYLRAPRVDKDLKVHRFVQATVKRAYITPKRDTAEDYYNVFCHAIRRLNQRDAKQKGGHLRFNTPMILQTRFALDTEAFMNALDRCRTFSTWSSFTSEDGVWRKARSLEDRGQNLLKRRRSGTNTDTSTRPPERNYASSSPSRAVIVLPKTQLTIFKQNKHISSKLHRSRQTWLISW